MKKILSLFLASLLTVITLAGCGTEENPSSNLPTSSETTTTSMVSSETTTTTSNPTSTSSKKSPSSSKNTTPSSSAETYSEEEIVLTEKEKIYYGMDSDIYKLSLKNEGNSARIASLMKKAQKGGSYKIAVIGGSISAGSSADNEFSSYGSLVCEWWSNNFPNSSFEFVNAGIGATNPEMACYRMGEDLLKFKPDFVVVDFTVNEYLDNNLYDTYSTILYKILSQKNSPAVMSIDFTRCNREKHDFANIYEKATDVPNSKITKAVKDYDIPAMSYHNYVWEKIQKRQITWRDIGADYIHPNNNGHLLASNIIACYLKKVMNGLSKASTKITAPQKPKTDKYLNLSYLTNTTKGVKLTRGFTANSNISASTRGWSYSAPIQNASLTIPIPSGKSVKIFMTFTDTADGQITVTDSKGNTKTISQKDAKTPTLVDVGKMENQITLSPSMNKGGFTIYGIGIEN